MALDMEKEIERSARGWDGFAKFLFASTAAVLAVLALMALTLL